MTPQETKRVHISNTHPQELLVIGSVAFDDIITPYEEGSHILGRAASFGSIAASYFAPTSLIGVVGNDFTEEDRAIFENRGIDLSGLIENKAGPSFYWKGRYHEDFNQRETLEINLNVFENYRPTLTEKFSEVPYVLLGNISPSLQLHVIKQIKNTPFIAADTIDLWIETARAELLELMGYIDLFIINDSEATLLTGENNLILAGKKLRTMGPKTVIVKKGEHGVYLFHEEGMFMLPAYPVTDLRDPTGAGDAFAGGLMGYLAAMNAHDFKTIKKAMVYGTITASLTVEAFSCTRLNNSECDEIVKRHEDLIDLSQLPE